MSVRGTNETLTLAKEIGHFIQYWGFKKIHGQIWTLVFLSKKPLNSTFMTKKLHVSKALISLAIKDLLEYKVIEVVEKKNKEIYFRSNPDLYSVILGVLESREMLMLEQIRKSHANLNAHMPLENSSFEIDGNKFEELAMMIHTAQDTLKTMIKNRLF